jgi:hypothetical protein
MNDDKSDDLEAAHLLNGNLAIRLRNAQRHIWDLQHAMNETTDSGMFLPVAPSTLL